MPADYNENSPEFTHGDLSTKLAAIFLLRIASKPKGASLYFRQVKYMEKIMSANDDRSDSMNPNNDAYEDSMDNHSDQLNPNNDAYQGSDNEDD